MRHTTKRHTLSQAQTDTERVKLRQRVIEAMWGEENAPDGTPCSEQPLIVAVCGCSSASGVIEFTKGRGICPLGTPWDCPGRRLA